jgi:hypothetical protein
MVLVSAPTPVRQFVWGSSLWVRIQKISTLAWQTTPPFYRQERGRPAVSSLGRSRKARVKPSVLPRVKPHVLVGPGVAWLSCIYYGGRHGQRGS